jgi:hypothetical protein
VLDNYVTDLENNDEEWSEFIDKDKTETSGNLPNNLNTQNQKNVEIQTCDISIDNDTDDEWCEETERPMHQVLWIHYYKNLT